MTTRTRPQKVAILGGGMGGLVTAYYLSNQPDWQSKFDITVYQLGWRLGGKCASSRGPNDRIEEHGIHGFMGSYFNALPMMSDLFKELGRKPGQPLATFEEAFLPSSFTMLWEWRNDTLTPWPVRAPTNDIAPTDGTSYKGPETAIRAMLSEISSMLETAPGGTPPLVGEAFKLLLARAQRTLDTTPITAGPKHPLIGVIEEARKLITGAVKIASAVAPKLTAHADELRRALLTLDFYSTLMVGTLKDNVAVEGYDGIDVENWSDWLLRHGLNPATLASPVVMTTVNICYQSPNGDTSRAARMGAGCFLDWTLRTSAYMGALIWSFASGTGETVVAPIYEVLRRRGVKFEFFHKVEALKLDPRDRKRVGAVEFTVQATLKDPERGYEPLIDVKGLPSWPRRPLYDQLVEGEAMEAGDYDLESYWCAWPDKRAPELLKKKSLKAGKDYDQLVFAISLGAVQYLCHELMEESEAWRGMVDNIPALQTQAMQLWLNEDMYAMGWREPLDAKANDLALSGTYFCPPNGNANFPDLLKWESWPKSQMPKSLWYLCGLMPDYETPPPFSDHDYPRRQADRVKAQCIQYLSSSIGTMLPNATVRARYGVGDPECLDFNLIVDTANPKAQGVARFDSQFWRANIDPTERYVTTPPGSSAYRLEAWNSGFSNLTLAGDWIYTGLNVGSFEGATMSGKLASHAVSGYPALDTVIGYPTMARPAKAMRRKTKAA